MTNTKKKLAVALSLTTALSLTACNSDDDKPADAPKSEKQQDNNADSNNNNSDDDSDSSDNSDSNLTVNSDASKDELRQKAAMSAEKLIAEIYDPSIVDGMTESQKETLAKADSVKHYDAIPKDDREEIVQTAEEVYKMEERFAGFDDLDEDDKAKMIVGLNMLEDTIKRSGMPKMSASIDHTVSKVDSGDDGIEVTFQKMAVKLTVAGQEKSSEEDIKMILADGDDQFRMDPDLILEYIDDDFDGPSKTRKSTKNGKEVLNTTEKVTLFDYPSE